MTNGIYAISKNCDDVQPSYFQQNARTSSTPRGYSCFLGLHLLSLVNLPHILLNHCLEEHEV